MGTTFKGDKERINLLKNSNKTFFLLLIFQCLVLAYVLIFCNVKYEVSDDFIMERIISGSYTGQINWHLPFSNPIWGLFIAAFYKILGRTVSWYFIALLAAGFASYVSISWVFAHKNNKILGIAVTVILTMTTAGDVYVLPQFTKTAAVAITAGCILFIYGLFEHGKIVPVICGAVLAIVGSFIRFKTLYAVGIPICIIVIFIIVRSIIKDKDKIKLITYKLIPCVIFVALLFLLNLVGNLIFSSDSYYRYYREYSSARSRIVDYEHEEYFRFTKKLANIDITANDYYLLTCWEFGDPYKFNLERMQDAADILDNYRISKEVTFETVTEHMGERNYLSYPVVWCILLLAVICSVANWRRIWIPFLCIVSSLFYVVLFFSLGRCVYRVEFGFLFSAAAIIAFCTDRERRSVIELVRAMACGLFSLAAIGYMGTLWFPKEVSHGGTSYRANIINYLYYSGDYLPEKYSAKVEYGKPYEEFTELVNSNPDNIYLLEFNTTIQTYYLNFSTFKSAYSVFPDNVSWIAGIDTGFLSEIQWRDMHEIESPLRDLLKDDIYYVGNDLVYSVEEFLRWNETFDVEVELVDKLDGYRIYKYSDGEE